MTKKKILLIRPKNIYGLQNYPPFGLILAGTALRGAGYDVEIMINEGRRDFGKELIRKAKGALFAGITATTAEIQDAITIAGILRGQYGKDLPLVWGGWHPTLFPDQMRDSDLVDFSVIREGEEGIIQIAHSISGNGRTCSNKIVSNDFTDMDKLMLPRYDLVENIEAFISRPLTDKFQEYCEGGFRWLPYESSRGCPYTCAFCINTVTSNNSYRAKNPKKVASELAEIVTKYGITHIKFIDDLFFVQIDRVRRIFEEAALLGVSYTWDAECRVDFVKKGFVDDEMMEFLKRSGLVQLTFGIESGSPESLKRMRKGGEASPDFAISAIRMCAKHGISSRGSFVLDVPGDTASDIMQTVKLIRKLREFPRFACGVHTYRPYPKSPFCEQLISEGKFYQPRLLTEWNDDNFVRQYTDTAVTRQWQANYKISSKVSFYESLESAFWIKPHQVKNRLIKLINDIFIRLARFRNRHQAYSFSIDRWLYLPFKNICVKRFIHNA